MKKDLLTDLSNHVMTKSMSKVPSSRSDSGIPRQPDGSVDYDTYIPVVFKHLNGSLKPKHFDTKNDNRSKSNAESVRYREDGNKICAGSSDHYRLAKALESYTKSIALAIPGSQEVALAHANRTAVLLHLDRPEECLLEIDRTLELGYPENLKYKLMIRRGECYAKLATESHAESRNWKLNAAAKKDVPPNEKNSEIDYEEVKKFEEELTFSLKDERLVPPITSRSKKFPCASSAVDVDCTTLNGRPYRRLVATRAIDAGETLIVEKPYFRWLLPENQYAYCSYCLDFAWECEPCGTCRNVIYCSETCRAAAWAEYHEIECPVLGLLIQYSSPQAACHGVRLLVQLCIEAGGLKQLKKRVEEFNSFTSDDPLRISYEWYQKCSLERILSLTTNEHDLLSNDTKFIKETVQLATCTLFLLASRTYIFGQQCHSLDEFESLKNDQDVLFFAKLLVKLSLIATCNIGPSSEVEAKGLVTKGFLIAPFMSFENHSCCPNTVLQFKTDHVVFHSIAFMEKGEEVTLSYCPPWYMASRQDRHNFLKAGSYFFNCSCQACVEDWPSLMEIASSQSKNFLCQNKIHPSERKVAARMFASLKSYVYKIGEGQIEEKDEMIKHLMTLVWYIYENNCVPCYELGILQGMITKLYSLTGTRSKLKKNFAKK